jgi:hypothetical protein
MLPTYQRFNNSSSSKIRSFRASEKILIFLVFISFLVIVLFGFFLLPDLSGSSGVIQKIKNAGPDIFIPAPPIERNRDTFDFDRQRLEQKIREFNDVDSEIEKPEILQPPKVPIVPLPVPDHNKNSQNDHKKSPSTADNAVGAAAGDMLYNADGQDQDAVARKRRDKVKEVSSTIVIDKKTSVTRHLKYFLKWISCSSTYLHHGKQSHN